MKPRVRRLQHGVAQRALELGVPWLVALPAEHPNKSHMLQLDEWSLRLSTSINRVYLDLCHFGSIDKTPTILVGTLPVARLSARLLKRADCINVLNKTDALAPDGYPAVLCKQFAHKILLAAVNHRTVMIRFACSKLGVHTSRPGVAHLPCERVSSDNPCKVLLTPRVSEVQDLECLGGLRSCRRGSSPHARFLCTRFADSASSGKRVDADPWSGVRAAFVQLVRTWMRQVLQLRIWPVREQHWQISYLLQVQRRSGTITFPLPSTTSFWQP